MKIDVLEKFIKNKSNYFIGLHTYEGSRGEEFQQIYLISTPSELSMLKPKGILGKDNEYSIDDSDITLELLKKVNSLYVETNIPLSDNFTPFQQGIRTSWFSEIHEIDGFINEFLLEVFTLRKEGKLEKYRIWDYLTLYRETCKKYAIKNETIE